MEKQQGLLEAEYFNRKWTGGKNELSSYENDLFSNPILIFWCVFTYKKQMLTVLTENINYFSHLAINISSSGVLYNQCCPLPYNIRVCYCAELHVTFIPYPFFTLQQY